MKYSARIFVIFLIFFGEIKKTIEQFILDNLTKRKKNEIIKKWSNRTDMFEKRVKINTNKGIISGHAKKIDDEGALIIKTKSGNERIFVGDVSLG